MSQTVAPQRTRQADLLAQYELLRRFGGSDRASVHLARDRVLGQQVAIKLFRDEYSRDPERIARLHAIARTAAGLSSGAVVRVLDHGTSWHAAFITSEWIEGRDLATLLEAEAPLPPRRAAAIIAQILDALTPAHAAGLIHGDLHPHNILLAGETDRVVLSDFGIGGLFPAHDGAAYAPYSAPELALASATDIFAAGALLHALVAPRDGAAATGETAALLAIADRAAAHDPAARYPDAPTMRAAIIAVVGPLVQPVAAPATQAETTPPPPLTPASAQGRGYSRRGLLVLLGGLLLGGAAGAGLLVRSATTPTPTEPTVAASLPQPTATTASAAQPDPTATIPAAQPTALPAQPTAAASVPSSAPQATVAPTATPTTAPAAPTATSAAPPVASNAPSAAPTAVTQPVVRYTATFDATWIENAYRRDDGTLYGRATVALYSVGTGYERGIITFACSDAPTVPLVLNLVGLDDEITTQNGFRVTLNGATIFDGVTTFPNVPVTDRGVGGASRYWGSMTIPLPSGAIRAGTNKLTLENTSPGGALGVPYILINTATITPAE